MKKIYHLSTCNTCQKILSSLNLSGIALQDIKTEPITTKQLDEMKNIAGSYEALFSKRSRQFRVKGLHEKTLSEHDYRDLILEEYTFLKRPVAIIDGKIYIGNSKDMVSQLRIILG